MNIGLDIASEQRQKRETLRSRLEERARSKDQDRPIHLGLERILELMERLGNPQRSSHPLAPRYIHVAGTNGKGSVIAFLAAMLRRAGFWVGTYTSPHLHSITERIQVQGVPIDKTAMDTLMERIFVANGNLPSTFFELTTAAAYTHLVECCMADEQNYAGRVVLLETGLGGRLDATNIVEPDLCIITPIGFDHMDYLGETLEQIIPEKLGIMKPGVPVIAQPGSALAEEMIQARAAELKSRLYLFGPDIELEPLDKKLADEHALAGTLWLPPVR